MDIKSVTKVIETFVPYYTQQHRHYHNWKHVENTLDAAVSLVTAGVKIDGDYTDLPDALFLAIVAHDSVYVPGAAHGQNEKLSAQMLYNLYNQKRLPACVTGESVDEAVRLIKLTANHVPKKRVAMRPFNDAVMMNADLATLGVKDYRSFERTQAAVLREYPLTSKHGQAEFLNRFMVGSIYAGSKSFNRVQSLLLIEWERAARSNISRFVTAVNKDVAI